MTHLSRDIRCGSVRTKAKLGRKGKATLAKTIISTLHMSILVGADIAKTAFPCVIPSKTQVAEGHLQGLHRAGRVVGGGHLEAVIRTLSNKAWCIDGVS